MRSAWRSGGANQRASSSKPLTTLSELTLLNLSSCRGGALRVRGGLFSPALSESGCPSRRPGAGIGGAVGSQATGRGLPGR